MDQSKDTQVFECPGLRKVVVVVCSEWAWRHFKECKVHLPINQLLLELQLMLTSRRNPVTLISSEPEIQ